MRDIKGWLGALGQEKCAPTFVDKEVEPAYLPLLPVNRISELGLPLVPRRRIQEALAIQALVAQEAEQTDHPPDDPLQVRSFPGARGSRYNLWLRGNARLARRQRDEPHVPVIDKSERQDGTFSNAEFRYDPERDKYTCPRNKALKKLLRKMNTPRDGVSKDGFRKHFARKQDCTVCALKEQYVQKQPTRKISRHVHEAAKDTAGRP